MEDCRSECSCQGGASRREVLAALSMAAVVLPTLAATAHAEGTTAPDDAGATWTKTIKPSELPEHGSHSITEPLLVLTRDGKTVMALSPKCTHKACTVKTPAGKTSLICPCHNAEFDYTGKNLQGPHKPGTTGTPSLPALSLYALRLNADGVIEVDTSKPRPKDDKSTQLTLIA